MATLVDSHDGREQTWQEFAFKFGNFLALLGWSWAMEEYMAQPGHVLMDGLGEAAGTISRNLYAVQHCTGTGAQWEIPQPLALGGATARASCVERTQVGV
eukprot:2564266-Amphidinium_carterae.4